MTRLMRPVFLILILSLNFSFAKEKKLNACEIERKCIADRMSKGQYGVLSCFEKGCHGTYSQLEVIIKKNIKPKKQGGKNDKRKTKRAKAKYNRTI